MEISPGPFSITYHVDRKVWLVLDVNGKERGSMFGEGDAMAIIAVLQLAEAFAELVELGQKKGGA